MLLGSAKDFLSQSLSIRFVDTTESHYFPINIIDSLNFTTIDAACFAKVGNEL
jgi:hypothetical protein